MIPVSDAPIGERGISYLVMVPSMSDTTTESVCSQTNIRAVHAVAPVDEREKVMVFAPDFRLSDF